MFIEEQENLVEETTEKDDMQTSEEVAENTAESVGDNAESSTENVEEKKYTDAEVDEIVKRKIARTKREYDKKYSKVESVLNKGLGTSNIDEATEKLVSFYARKGIKIEDEPKYSEHELKIIANAEADEIISYGYEEIKEEVDRLAEIGYENMSDRDKIIFTKLANERTKLEDEKALNSIGVSRDAIDDAEFKEYAKKLNPNLPLKEKYEMYLQSKPKKQIETIGSMKNTQASQVKEYYSPEEISRLTDEELDDPLVWEAVRKSMTRNNQ